jgi:hypothetical protein
MGAHINPAGWEPWSTAEPNTSGVLFAEFGSTGASFCFEFIVYIRRG